MPADNGRSGPPGAGFGAGSRFPGAGGGGRPGGGGGSGGRPGGGGRDGGRGGGERREREGGSGPGYRVVSELSTLEKALTKVDFQAQRGSLDQILKSLRPLRLKSLDDLDLNTRGKLITTLLRVQRQPRPPPSPVAEAVSDVPVAAEEGESAPPEAASLETPPTADDPGISEGSPTVTKEQVVAEAAPLALKDVRAEAYGDALVRVGQIWRSVGEGERAVAAFASSGRPVDEATLRKEEEAAAAQAQAQAPVTRERRDERSARPPREGREGRSPREGGREERPPRTDRPERAERPRREREPLPELTGDWREQAQQLETRGRTRDAGRLHERNQSFADALRLFEAGGDFKSALRNALAGQDTEATKRIAQSLKPAEAEEALEKAQAYDVLMEMYVAGGQFDNVARLYERARQFDQAALAWERAGKLTQARKAFERVHDFKGAERVRTAEVAKLIERGDRLGAATLLAHAGQRVEAGKVLEGLPSPKAFRFFQKIGLTEEAQAIAQAELQKAETENKPSQKARWLELTGDKAGAAAAWEAADRKDKAFPLYEALGDVAKAATLAEAAGAREKAIELYTKLGDTAAVARATALPVEVSRSARDAADAAEALDVSGTDEPSSDAGTEPGQDPGTAPAAEPGVDQEAQ